ncbi:MAG TPA: C4-type zinc ribbon domain-containing protein [bacterium]|nr:C4-type zinc ribbon domain-containing protein [bacterium]
MGSLSEEILILKQIQKIEDNLSSFELEKQKKKEDYNIIKIEYDKIKIEYDSIANQINKCNDEIKKIEETNADSAKKIESSRAKMFGVKSQREFDALKSEIKTFQTNISENETKQLGYMEELEKLNSKIPAFQEKVNDYENQMSGIMKVIDSYMDSVSENIKKLLDEKSVLFSKLKPRAQQIFNKIFNAKKTPVLSKIAGTTCSSCNIDIPPQTVNEIRKENKIFTCDSCNRILFWEE